MSADALAEQQLAALAGTDETYMPERGRTIGRLRLLTTADARQLPPRRYLLQGLIAVGEIVLLYGAPKTGKSFLAARLAYGLARGIGFGAHGAGRTARCLYIAAEGEAGFPARIVSLGDALGDAGDLFTYIAQRVNLGSPGEHLEDLIEAAVAVRAELLVIDTVARTFGKGDENSATDVMAFVAALDRLREAVNARCGIRPTIILVHHSPKAGDSPRGSNALPAAADCVIRVEGRGNGPRLARVVEAKDDPDGAELSFELKTVDLVGAGADDIIRTAIAEPATRSAKVHGAAAFTPLLRDWHRHICEVFADPAVAKEQFIPPGETALVTAVRRDALRAALRARGMLTRHNVNVQANGPLTSVSVCRRLRHLCLDAAQVASGRRFQGASSAMRLMGWSAMRSRSTRR